ncbi:MAG: HlyD family efflux transporter periplasmic adaptor subunit [Candidatus Rokubacteria bacterium]|nr:HlyD family efflux transporter periplasmic adaptor subunit [Candidatus Rokubacteria bacterium]
MSRPLKLAATAALVLLAGLAATWTVRRLNGHDRTVGVTGTIEALQVEVSAKIAGRIVERTVREGQPVERGQLLVHLGDEELAAEVRRAEAAVRTAEAQLRDLQAGARREEIEEAEARAARARAQLDDLLAGSRQQEIEQARAAVRNATAVREWSERELARTRELYARDLVAFQEVDRARNAYDVAAANEASARERLALLEAGARKDEIDAARAELRAAQERVRLLRAGPRPDAVAAARAQVAETRAALALGQVRLGEMRIRSPITGLVLRKNLEVGEMANPGVSILTLMDPQDMWLRAYVSETEVGRIRIGQQAVITVDAFPGRTFAGAISEIASEAEFTPKNVQTKKERVTLVFRVKIAVHYAEGVLKPGLPADAQLRP